MGFGPGFGGPTDLPGVAEGGTGEAGPVIAEAVAVGLKSGAADDGTGAPGTTVGVADIVVLTAGRGGFRTS